MTPFPTGTVTFLLTDIEGSARHALDHPDTWECTRQRHDDILRSAIEACQGYVFKVIGDGFCAAFHTAGSALQAAIRAQIDLYAADWGAPPIKARMGIHTGNAVILDDGDYSGYMALCHAQRLMSAGHGGQTLVSRSTHELVRHALPQGLILRDMGEHRLKDLIHPEPIYQALIPNLPDDFPPLKTLATLVSNLPVQMTAFIGREREIAAVAGMIRHPDIRLVTLTGTGGTGKTRLALKIAGALSEEYDHGVWFVDLSPITEPELVMPTIAAVLKVKESAGGSSEQAVHEYLANRRLLLVIDSFEQVIGAAPMVGRLLAAAPKVKVLVSSREILRLRGEHDFPVPPLGLPDSKRQQTLAELAKVESIALFIQHARAANPAFELDDHNAATVAAICGRLEGLPLAIELAAARSRLFKPAAILEKLKNRLGMLTGGARDTPRRQQTIRDAIDWSYDLLDDGEKGLFERLGVFTGGWTAESAVAVCGGGQAGEVWRDMESLLDKSLLRQIDGGGAEVRFTMLETIREYAMEKLTESGALAAIRDAHARDVAGLLDKAVAAQSGAEEVLWYAKLDDDLDNLRGAVEWTLAHHRPELAFKAGDLYRYWYQRSNPLEAFAWLERALAIKPEGPLKQRAIAMKTAGNLLLDIGNETAPLALQYYESSLALFRELDDQAGIGSCLNNLGNIEHNYGNFDRSRELYEQSLAYDTADSYGMSVTLNNLGDIARIKGDWQAAKEYYLRARRLCVDMGAETAISFSGFYLGNLATVRRELDDALGYYEGALKAAWLRANPPVFRVLGGLLGYVHLLVGNDRVGRRMLDASLEAIEEYLHHQFAWASIRYWPLLEGKARLELMDGRAERAATLLGASWALRENEHLLAAEAIHPDYETIVTRVRSILGEGAYDKAFGRGRAMTMLQAIRYAMFGD